jgi:hypothetical protein
MAETMTPKEFFGLGGVCEVRSRKGELIFRITSYRAFTEDRGYYGDEVFTLFLDGVEYKCVNETGVYMFERK